MNALSRLFAFVRCLALLGVLAGVASPALAGKTYSDNLDGTVTDPTTGLVWMRCSMGQTWDGTTCNGAADTYSFNQANTLTGNVTFAGQSDWRVPNIRELESIVDRTRSSPAIDSRAFPYTFNSNFYDFWSSSNRTNSSTVYAWYIHFSDGSVMSHGIQSSSYGVRLVRAGKSVNLLSLSRPSTDYVVHDNGTVTHTPTGLTWLRCVEGQVWNGSTCTGVARVVTWDVALTMFTVIYGPTYWRFPTEEELMTLVDYSVNYPSINSTIFPNSASAVFWSLSKPNPSLSGIWGIDFGSGDASLYDNISYPSNLHSVRKVYVTFAQNLIFDLAPTLVGGGTSTVSAIGGGSGNPVTFTSTTPTICTVAGSTVTALTAGNCVIAANQAGNANYSAAPQATQSIAVSSSTQILNFAQGWNLVGNGTDAPINVATAFADSSQFVTIWKWHASQSAWSIYAPALAAQGGTVLADYAASKGYQVLNSVAGGEGFWVNVKQPASVSVTQGQSISVASVGSTLLKGWNLVSVGESATPKQFSDAQTMGVTTLWAWDAAGGAWYFYAPTLDTNGGLTNYVASKGYLDFAAGNQRLGNGVGFWVNKP